MFGARWYKVLNDLANNKTRSGLIILSIAVGLFAMGTILSARSILATEMAAAYAAIVPASGTVRTLQTFDQDFIQAVRHMPEVAEVDARRALEARIEVAPGEWINLRIFSVEDFDSLRVNKIWPQAGAWPPPPREILIERSALPVIRAAIGDRIRIETASGKQVTMRVAGTAHDLAQIPAQFDNSPYGYISFDTLEWLGEPYGYNELHIVPAVQAGAAAGELSQEDARRVITAVEDKAEQSGMIIPLSMSIEPGQLPLGDFLDAILLVMGALGLLALFLSAFLIINTISALLSQQKRQIGVMKAVGAHTGQVVVMYLVMVGFYGVFALALAVPASFYGARALSVFMAGLFNFDLAQTGFSLQALTVQIVVGLVVPVLASLAPLLANVRISPAEAMSSFQTGKGRFGAGWIDRFLSGANLWFARFVLRRPALLSLRNIFRSKGRLILTLTTLVLASATFIAVFNLNAALAQTVDEVLQLWNFDLQITFTRPHRVSEMRALAEAFPGVAASDAWIQTPARRVRPDGSESGLVYLFSPRAGSPLAQSPALVAGRWLVPGDENAIVVSTNFIQDEPDVTVGDTILVNLQGEERSWQVVGISKGIMLPMAYANYSYIAELTCRVGRGDAVLIRLEPSARADIGATVSQLEAYYERYGMRAANIQTLSSERREAALTFGLITSLMMVMAVLLAAVGGLGLMGTVSINVLERTREIGVLRAIGAPNRSVVRVFLLEGIAIGIMSWFLGAWLSIPLSRALGAALGQLIAGGPLTFRYSFEGAGLWFFLVVLLSALASFLPAQGAARLTVREVLAYE